MSQIMSAKFDPRSQHIWVLHRGDRYWGPKTFDSSERVRDRRLVERAVILKLDGSTGMVVQELGGNMFSLPHGLTVSDDGMFLYVTDVGLHEVVKMRADTGEVVMRLGTQFQPGKGPRNFCKPTAIELFNGKIYVSDGYCNSRVVVFSEDGRYLTEMNSNFKIAHNLDIDRTNGIIYVADREGQTIQKFDIVGNQLDTLRNPAWSSIYDIEVREDGDELLVLSQDAQKGEAKIYVIPTAKQNSYQDYFRSPYDNSQTARSIHSTSFGLMENDRQLGLHQGHSVDVSPDGTAVVVSSMFPPRIRLFTKQNIISSWGDGKLWNKNLVDFTSVSSFESANKSLSELGEIITARGRAKNDKHKGKGNKKRKNKGRGKGIRKRKGKGKAKSKE